MPPLDDAQGPWLTPLEVAPGPELLAHPQEPVASSWITLLLLGIFLLLAWINKVYRKRTVQLANAFVSNRFVQQIIREEGVLTGRGSLALNLATLLIVSMFLFQVVRWANPSHIMLSDGLLYSAIAGGLTLWALAKLLLVSASGVLLKAENEVREYLFNMLLFNQFLGLVLLPLVLCLAFIPGGSGVGFVIAGGVLAAGVFAFRVIKAGYLGFANTNFSGMYIILYLCTLEILPLMLLIKVLGLT